jgi:hypothetical protein
MYMYIGSEEEVQMAIKMISALEVRLSGLLLEDYQIIQQEIFNIMEERGTLPLYITDIFIRDTCKHICAYP